MVSPPVPTCVRPRCRRRRLRRSAAAAGAAARCRRTGARGRRRRGSTTWSSCGGGAPRAQALEIVSDVASDTEVGEAGAAASARCPSAAHARRSAAVWSMSDNELALGRCHSSSIAGGGGVQLPGGLPSFLLPPPSSSRCRRRRRAYSVPRVSLAAGAGAAVTVALPPPRADSCELPVASAVQWQCSLSAAAVLVPVGP